MSRKIDDSEGDLSSEKSGVGDELFTRIKDRPVSDDEREDIGEWFGEFQPPLRIQIMQAAQGGVTVDEFNEKFKRSTDDTRHYDNVNCLIDLALIVKTELDQGKKGYRLTELGRFFHSYIEDFIVGARVAERARQFVRGVPDSTKLEDFFLPEFVLLAEYGSFDVIPNADSALGHAHLLQQVIDGRDRVRIVSPWPGITSIDCFKLNSALHNHEFIVSKTYVERMGERSLRTKIVEQIQNEGPQITVREYPDRFPYMLVLAEESVGENGDFAQNGHLALWGKGEVDDNYSVFVETSNPELLKWGEEVFKWVSERTKDGSLKPD